MKFENPITRVIPRLVAVAGLSWSLNLSALTFKNVDPGGRNAIDVHFQYVLRGVTKDFDSNVAVAFGATYNVSTELSKGYVADTFEFSYADPPKRVKGKSVPESLNTFGVSLISFVSLLVLKRKSRC